MATRLEIVANQHLDSFFHVNAIGESIFFHLEKDQHSIQADLVTIALRQSRPLGAQQIGQASARLKATMKSRPIQSIDRLSPS